MSLSDHVSFNGDYDTEHTPAMPAGKEIADQLANALTGKEIIIINRYQTDYSHGIEVSVNGTKFFLEVGAVGDEHANWLAYFGLKFNFLGILGFISAKKHDLLAITLNEALHIIPRITNIRWYKNQHTWNYNSSNYTVSP